MSYGRCRQAVANCRHVMSRSVPRRFMSCHSRPHACIFERGAGGKSGGLFGSRSASSDGTTCLGIVVGAGAGVTDGRDGGIGARGAGCADAVAAARQDATARQAITFRIIFGEEATPIPPCEMLDQPGQRSSAGCCSPPCPRRSACRQSAFATRVRRTETWPRG